MSWSWRAATMPPMLPPVVLTSIILLRQLRGSLTTRFAPFDTVKEDETIIAIITADGQKVDVKASRNGYVIFHAENDSPVASSDLLASVKLVSREGNDSLELVVGGDYPDWEYKSWDEDFNKHTVRAVETWAAPNTGKGMDIVIDSAGDVWKVGEGSTHITQITPTGINGADVKFHRTPLKRISEPDGTAPHSLTQPYLYGYDNQYPRAASNLGERIIDSENTHDFDEGRRWPEGYMVLARWIFAQF